MKNNKLNNKLNKKYFNLSIEKILIRMIHNSCVLNLENNTGINNENGNNQNDYIIESLFDVFSKDVVKQIFDIYKKDERIINDFFNKIDSYMFVTSLSLSELLSDNSESKNVIASTNFLINPVSDEIFNGKLISNLNEKNYDNDLYIIKVSWLNTIDLKNEIKTQEFSFSNIYSNERKLIIRDMGYPTFFKNINIISESISSIEKENKNYLGINPIIFFKGLSWNNIVHIFKLNNIIINGGSITKRHKLSICDYRLAVFLSLLGIYEEDKSSLYKSYKEKNYSSPRFNKQNEINMENHGHVTQYLYINESLDLNLKLNSIKTNIFDVESNIDKIKSELKRLDLDININMSKINQNKLDISFLKNKFDGNLRSKHKGSLTGRIKKYQSEIIRLNNSINNKNSVISSLKNKLNKEIGVLGQLKSEYNKISNGLIQNNSNIKVIKNNIGPNNISNLSNRREYHSLTQIKNYSTNNSIKKINFNINSPIFIELQRILNNSPLDYNTQLKIEKFLHNQGVILLTKRLNQDSDINYYKLNPKVLEYFKNSIEELDILINNYKANLKANYVKNNKSVIVEFTIISELYNEIIISQLLGRLLRIISNNNLNNHNTNCTELAFDLGQSLLFSYYSLNYQQQKEGKALNNDYGLSQFIKDNYLSFNNSVTDIILIQIGLKLLYFLEEVGLIHSETHFKEKDKKNNIFVANEKILNDIGKSLEFLNISYKIPMIVPPKKYTRVDGKDILGGFLLNDIDYTLPLIIKNSELKEQSSIKDVNIIFDTVNNLSSVGYKINTDVLEFILEKGIEYDLITDPDFKHPIEIKKINQKKLTISENNSLDSFLSKKQLEMNILGLALTFKNVPEFFIPVRIDNRGRVYCICDYLNYQGVELAKSLLLFSKGEKINKFDKQSIDYLKIFGGNCFGNGINKKSYNDRVEWVNNNEEDILNFRNGKLIKEADSKLLFIAFCFEYVNYHNSLFSNETYYISHFPIQLDATCNGYQHLSLLTGDEPLAGHLNLISGNKNTKPNDFYDFVALKINDYLISQLAEEKLKLNFSENVGELDVTSKEVVKKKIESFERLQKLNKTRSLVKLPIMVRAYNASKLTMIDYFKDNFDKVIVNPNDNKDLLESKFNITINDDKVLFKDSLNNNVYLNNKDLALLVNIMEKVISNEFPKLNEFSLYLNEIAKICVNLNITISWPLPTGLKVNQYYVDSEAIRLKPFKFRSKTFSIKVSSGKVNKRKQIRALMPNLIHSLDAASLCLLINMFYLNHCDDSKKINFFAIHDCFAVTANNVTNLIKYIKLVYIKIYSEDSYLEKFDIGIINIIKLHYGNESFDENNKIITVNDVTFKYPDVNEVIMGKIKAFKIQKAEYPIH